MKKDYLKKLDEFLAAFDVEELIKDGVGLIIFTYKKKNQTIKKTFTINEFKKEKEKRLCNS